jgi:hypothetical protein
VHGFAFLILGQSVEFGKLRNWVLPRDPALTLLSRNSSRYLSSLALVILRNTDSRHFSDTVILPTLRFRFLFPLPPASLLCFSPPAWRCWWPEEAVD